MLNKLNIFNLTDTVKRLTLWNALLFILILLVFNAVIITLINYILHENIDVRLKHEMENILNSFEVTGDSITIINYREFEERDLKEVTENPYFLQIYDERGRVLITSDNIQLYHQIPFNHNYIPEDFTFEDMIVVDDRLRVGYVFISNEKNEVVATMQLATFETEYLVIMQKILLANLVLLPFMLIFVLIASIFLARHSFSPLNKIIETAKKISAANLNERIEYAAKPADELGKVRDTLNELFERMETYFGQLSQFTDHASHQLMNPLTAIKAEIDFALRKKRSPEDYLNSFRVLREQTDRMIKIINALLVLSKQERGADESRKLFNLSLTIDEKIRHLFGNERVRFEVDKEIYVKGDENLFEIVLENLIDNALKYSDKHDSVMVELKKFDSIVKFIIKDQGLGISNNEKKRIFDRFYRIDDTQKLGIKGYGLGLSLVKAIVVQAGGTISVEDNFPKGTVFTVSLPAVVID